MWSEGAVLRSAAETDTFVRLRGNELRCFHATLPGLPGPGSVPRAYQVAAEFSDGQLLVDVGGGHPQRAGAAADRSNAGLAWVRFIR
jgi:hypothetical protein